MPTWARFGWTPAKWQAYARSPQLWLFVATVLLFNLLPQIDIAASSLFRDPGSGFTVGQLFAVRVLHEGWDIAALSAAVVLVLSAGEPHWRAGAARTRRAATFLFLVLLIGPGLIVNTLKDTCAARHRRGSAASSASPRWCRPTRARAAVPLPDMPHSAWWMAPARSSTAGAAWFALGLAGPGHRPVRIAQGATF